jgi:very-short-patch-repair endonuclease
VGDQRRVYDTPGNNHSADEALAALAGRQHGVVSRVQLRAVGLTKDAIRRRVERQRLLRVHPGVYAVGHVALTVDSRRMAAVLACGRGALLSHRAAGALQALLSWSPQFDVTVSGGVRSGKRGPVVVHRSRSIEDEDRDVVRGIPVTSVARTIVDLADVLSDEKLARAIREAELRRVLDVHAIERVFERLSGRRGRHRLARVLAAYRPDLHFTRSMAERRFVALCKRHGLPAPSINVSVKGYEVDAYWSDLAIVVEVDGEPHLTRAAFHQDRARDRALNACGIRVVRVTQVDLDDEARLAAELRAVRAAARASSASA